MTTTVEKEAEELATRAVERKYMRKEAQGEGFTLSPIARNALLGTLIGGAGTGAVSALSGRRGGSLARDLLMGAAVGGAGGAAYPYISETVKDLSRKVSGPELTPAERSAKRQKDISKAVQGTGGPGVEAGLTGARDVLLGVGKGLYGEGSGADVGSYVVPAGLGAGVTTLSHLTDLSRSGKLFKTLPESMPVWKRRVSHGLRFAPTGKALKHGLVSAFVAALLERAMRMPTPQGAAQ